MPNMSYLLNIIFDNKNLEAKKFGLFVKLSEKAELILWRMIGGW